MKKFTIVVMLFIGFAMGMNAQEPNKKITEKKETKTVVKTVAKESIGPRKADGTLDKRYKANKATADKVTLKKDGTPDRRYKQNKN